MVYCHLVATQPNPIDATEVCIADISSIDSNEVRIIFDWRQWHMNDANSVTAAQPYDAAPGN